MRKFSKKIVERYLRFLTKALLVRFEPDIVAIAGTTGKTRTKEMVKKILLTNFTVRANPRSYNTEIGLPLSVLYAEAGGSSILRWLGSLAKATITAGTTTQFPSKLVLELGTDRSGDMDYLLSIVSPDILIVSSLSPSHLGHFEDLEEAAEEIAKAAKKLPKSGLLVVNADEEWTRHIAKHTKAQVISFGISRNAQIRASKIHKSQGRLSAEVMYDSGKKKYRRTFTIPGTTEQHLYALLSAVAIGIHFNVGLKEASDVLKN